MGVDRSNLSLQSRCDSFRTDHRHRAASVTVSGGIPISAIEYWLEEIAPRIQHVSLISKKNSNSSAYRFPSAALYLPQLPALTSLSVVGLDEDSEMFITDLYESLRRANNISSLAICTWEAPNSLLPALRNLSIAESRLQAMAARPQDIKPHHSVRSLTIDHEDVGPCGWSHGRPRLSTLSSPSAAYLPAA